jgi:hypothetical protein
LREGGDFDFLGIFRFPYLEIIHVGAFAASDLVQWFEVWRLNAERPKRLVKCADYLQEWPFVLS